MLFFSKTPSHNKPLYVECHHHILTKHIPQSKHWLKTLPHIAEVVPMHLAFHYGFFLVYNLLFGRFVICTFLTKFFQDFFLIHYFTKILKSSINIIISNFYLNQSLNIFMFKLIKLHLKSNTIAT